MLILTLKLPDKKNRRYDDMVFIGLDTVIKLFSVKNNVAKLVIARNKAVEEKDVTIGSRLTLEKNVVVFINKIDAAEKSINIGVKAPMEIVVDRNSIRMKRDQLLEKVFGDGQDR